MMLKKSIKHVATRILGSVASLPPEFVDWASILRTDRERWNAAREAAKNGPKVLIANCAGIDSHVTTVESLLAVALTLRGADVHILLCDETLPACWLSFSHRIPPAEFVKHGPSKRMCGKCFLNGSMLFGSLGLQIHRYSDFLSSNDLERAANLSSTVAADELESFSFDGIKVGEQALAGALRYYSRGDLQGEPEGEGVLRRYLNASLLSMFAVRRLLSKFSFGSVCGIHGIYVPEGIIGEVARSQNVRMVSWNDTYRKHTFIFSHYDTYHRTMLCEPTENWQNMPWTEEMESEILEYLKSRWYGTHDWIKYSQDWMEDISPIAAELGIDFTKPCIGLLTNVIWDAQVHYGGNAFPNMLEWTLQTIEYFANRPDLQLIVRVHPAEVRADHKSRQFMVDEIARAIPNLPKNVFVIPPDSPMNTYAAMAKCDAAIIYGTKAGVELSSMGIPVIVAGEAWIRNKGLTLDASSPQEYFAILDRLPLQKRMSEETIQLARKYAYHFFFRRQIPVPVLQEAKGNAFTKLEIAGIEDVLPGRYPGLDVICDGIINGDEFIYPAELYPESLSASGKFSASGSAGLSIKRGNKPLVSVIVVTGSDRGNLPAALDSVYGQHGAGEEFDLEIIVVDNAAFDIGARVWSQHAGFHHIRLDRSISKGAARNVGLRASTGKYVAFLDEGDLWLLERLRSQINILEHHPGFGAVYGQCTTTGLGEETLWPDAGKAPAGSVFKAFAMEELAMPSFLTVRRTALERAGDFDETLQGFEHFDMCLRLATFVRFAFIAGPVGKCVYSEKSAWETRLQRREHETELPYVLNKAFKLLPDNDDREDLTREIFGYWFARIADYLDKLETVEPLRAHVLRSLEKYPWMMSHPTSMQSIIAYAAKVLLHSLRDRSNPINPLIRGFCRDVIGRQNGSYQENILATRRFLGDTLTQTAGLMWERRDFQAAAVAATYAISHDSTQIVRQARGASKRLAHILLPGVL